MGLVKSLVFCLAALLLSGCLSSRNYRDQAIELDAMKAENEALRRSLQQKNDEKETLRIFLETALDTRLGQKKDLKDQIAVFTETLNEKETRLRSQNEKLNDCRVRLRMRRREAERARADRERIYRTLLGTYNELLTRMHAEIRSGTVQVARKDDAVSMRFVEKILFESGSVAITGGGRNVLDRVADILRPLDGQDVRVEGHTDNVPISSRLAGRFPTNWELSAIRAVNVARYLAESGGVDPARLSADARSEYRPIASNETPAQRAMNRRIEIILLPEKSDSADRPAPDDPGGAAWRTRPSTDTRAARVP